MALRSDRPRRTPDLEERSTPLTSARRDSSPRSARQNSTEVSEGEMRRRRCAAMRDRARSDRELVAQRRRQLASDSVDRARSSSPFTHQADFDIDNGEASNRTASDPPPISRRELRGFEGDSSREENATTIARSSSSKSISGVVRHGLFVSWQTDALCQKKIPASDSSDSWLEVDLGSRLGGGEKRSCFLCDADVSALKRPLGFERLQGVPTLSQDAAFDVILGKPLHDLVKKSALAREEAYVLCRWSETDGLGEASEPERDKSKPPIPFGFEESRCQQKRMQVKVMIQMDELRTKSIFKLFSQVSLAPESCEVWWQVGPPSERFLPGEPLNVELQTLDVDESAFEVSGDEVDERFSWLNPHQKKSVRWMASRETSLEPFLADWHVYRPLGWELRESLSVASKDTVVPPAASLGAGPVPLQLEVRLENRYDIRGGVLADPIGSGKTATCLTLVARTVGVALPPLPVGDWRRNYLLTLDATLLICPDSVHHQWPLEVEKWPQLSATIEVVPIRSVDDLVQAKLSSPSEGMAQLVVVPFSIFEDPQYRLKLHSPLTSSKWKTQVWSYQQKAKRDKNSSGLALESYQWRRVIIDEFHEFASTTSGHPAGQRVLRFLQSFSRWGVTGTPEDLLRNLGSVQCAAKLFHCEFNARRSAITFCEQFYRSSRVEMSITVNPRLVTFGMSSAEVAIYVHTLHEIRHSGPLPPQPWDEDWIDSLTRILQLCSHFAPEDAPSKVKDAESALKAAQALLKHKSDLVTRALLRIENESRHWGGCAMMNEDRWTPPGEPNPDRKKKGGCSECSFRTCHDCVREAFVDVAPANDCKEAQERFHKRPMEVWRACEYFYSVWCLVSGGEASTRDCIICLETYALERFSLLGCGHLFCSPCLDDALKMHSKKRVCPMCRAAVETDAIVPVEVLRRPKKTVHRPGGEISRFAKYGTKLQNIVESLLSVKASDPTAKVILFSQWQSLESKIASSLREFSLSYLRLTDCSDLFEKRRMLEEFQDPDNDKAYVLLLSLDGHASGTNLVVANHVFLVHPMVASSLQQQLAYEKQAIGRAARLGQKRPVTVWRFIAESTVEEEIAQSLRST